MVSVAAPSGACIVRAAKTNSMLFVALPFPPGAEVWVSGVRVGKVGDRPAGDGSTVLRVDRATRDRVAAGGWTATLLRGRVWLQSSP